MQLTLYSPHISCTFDENNEGQIHCPRPIRPLSNAKILSILNDNDYLNMDEQIKSSQIKETKKSHEEKLLVISHDVISYFESCRIQSDFHKRPSFVLLKSE